MTPEEIATRIGNAAALIEKGWIKGDYYDAEWKDAQFVRKIAFCSMGALYEAFTQDMGQEHRPELITAIKALTKVIFGKDGRWSTSDIICWNDADEREKQEVLDAFHKAEKLVLGVEE